MRRLATRWLLCSASLGGRIKTPTGVKWRLKQLNQTLLMMFVCFWCILKVCRCRVEPSRAPPFSLSLPPSRAWLLQLAPLCIGSCQTARAGHKRDPAVVLRHTYTKWAWLPLTCNMGHTRTHTYTHTDSCQLEPLKINMKTTMTSYYVSWGE